MGLCRAVSPEIEETKLRLSIEENARKISGNVLIYRRNVLRNGVRFKLYPAKLQSLIMWRFMLLDS